MNTKDILENRLVAIQKEIEAIQFKADAERRDLTSSENSEVDKLAAEFDDVEAALSDIDASYQPQKRGQKADPQPVTPQAGRAKRNGKRPSRFVNLATGEPIPAYKRGEAISNLPADDFSVGEICRAMALGDLSLVPKDIRASVSVGDDAGGGYLTSSTLSSRFVDLAREASVCVRAGADSVSLPSGEVQIGTLETDPSHYWRQETASITASKPAFGQITMRPKVVAVLIPISMEFAEDSVNGVNLIQQTVGNVLATAIDQAALTGSGAAAEPLGLTNHSSVNSRTSVGTPSNYSDVSSAVGDILAANFTDDVSNLSWVLPPAIATTYDQLTTGITNDSTPLQPTSWVSKLQRFYTTSLSASSDSPEQFHMLTGDFRELLFGFRMGGMRMQLLDAGTATDADSVSYNAVTDMMVFLRAYIRFDVAVLRPSWFTNLAGVTR